MTELEAALAAALPDLLEPLLRPLKQQLEQQQAQIQQLQQRLLRLLPVGGEPLAPAADPSGGSQQQTPAADFCGSDYDGD